MPSGASTLLVQNPEEIYEYYDDPAKFFERQEAMLERVERRMAVIRDLDVKPDFLLCGASGSLVFQSPKIFRELACRC